jgi:hypothetical protein
MQNITYTFILGTAITLTSCSSEEAKPVPPSPIPAPTVVAPPPPVQAPSGHGHNHGNQPIINESLTIAGVTLNIAAQGNFVPGADYHIEIALVSGTQGAVVRLWIGEEDGVGSLKTKAGSHGDHYHGHALVPIKINSKTALWVDVTGVDGQTGKGRIALK